MNRRYFLSSSIALGAFAVLARLPVGAMLWQNPRSSKDAGGGDAKVSGDGSKSKGFKKVIKSDAEWRQLLTPEQYNVLRRKGTEYAYSSPLNDIHEQGTFECAGC